MANGVQWSGTVAMDTSEVHMVAYRLQTIARRSAMTMWIALGACTSTGDSTTQDVGPALSADSESGLNDGAASDSGSVDRNTGVREIDAAHDALPLDASEDSDTGADAAGYDVPDGDAQATQQDSAATPDASSLDDAHNDTAMNVEDALDGVATDLWAEPDSSDHPNDTDVSQADDGVAEDVPPAPDSGLPDDTSAPGDASTSLPDSVVDGGAPQDGAVEDSLGPCKAGATDPGELSAYDPCKPLPPVAMVLPPLDSSCAQVTSLVTAIPSKVLDKSAWMLDKPPLEEEKLSGAFTDITFSGSTVTVSTIGITENPDVYLQDLGERRLLLLSPDGEEEAVVILGPGVLTTSASIGDGGSAQFGHLEADCDELRWWTLDATGSLLNQGVRSVFTSSPDARTSADGSVYVTLPYLDDPGNPSASCVDLGVWKLTAAGDMQWRAGLSLTGPPHDAPSISSLHAKGVPVGDTGLVVASWAHESKTKLLVHRLSPEGSVTGRWLYDFLPFTETWNDITAYLQLVVRGSTAVIAVQRNLMAPEWKIPAVFLGLDIDTGEPEWMTTYPKLSLTAGSSESPTALVYTDGGLMLAALNGATWVNTGGIHLLALDSTGCALADYNLELPWSPGVEYEVGSTAGMSSFVRTGPESFVGITRTRVILFSLPGFAALDAAAGTPQP